MQNEILKPVLATDETAIPRYDIVNPDGSVSQQNVELRLKNEVMQQGTPYDEESVLPATLCEKLGIPTSATLAQALQVIVNTFNNVFTKNETLSLETKAIAGLTTDSVPNDMFLYLVLGRGKYAYSIHVEFPWGEPYVGATVTGGTTIDGEPAVTDSNGNVVIVAETSSITIGVSSPYFDVASASNVVVASTGTLTNYTLTLRRIANDGEIATITASLTSKLSPNVDTYDVCLVGGGGGGTGKGGSGCPGGGGGYVTNQLGLSRSNDDIVVKIGGGGGGVSPYSTGGTGGTTTFVCGIISLSASGGTGAKSSQGAAYPVVIGKGNGDGGSDSNGKDGTGFKFNDEALGLAGGGGGAGGGTSYTGGAPYGGNANGGNGRGPGGGGAGITSGTGGSGYKGVVYMRFHYKGV